LKSTKQSTNQQSQKHTMKFSIIAVLVTVASVASLPVSPAGQSGAPVPATPMSSDVSVLSDTMHDVPSSALERRELTEAQKAAEELLYPLYRTDRMVSECSGGWVPRYI
jgi:hypothetical protein